MNGTSLPSIQRLKPRANWAPTLCPFTASRSPFAACRRCHGRSLLKVAKSMSVSQGANSWQCRTHCLPDYPPLISSSHINAKIQFVDTIAIRTATIWGIVWAASSGEQPELRPGKGTGFLVLDEFKLINCHH